MRFYNIRYILCALCILFSCYHDGLAQTCDDVAVSISTTPVSCPDKNTGGVNIDVTGGEIVDFDWADGFIELEPQDLYAGSYELSLVIEISEGFTCTVPKMVVIGQPQVEVKLSVKDVSDCHETDGEILIDHLFEAEEINMNCSTMEIIEEYPTDGWIEISGYVAEDESYTISAGQQVVITEDCIFLGQLTIDGGTVVNKGYLRPSSININSFSEIRNYGSLNIMSDNEAQPNTLIIPTDIIFYNFGSLTIDIIELSGSLNNTNGDVLCNYLTLVTPDAIINNTGDIIVNNQLENNGFIVNDFEFQVDISFINNKSLNNACKLTCLNAFSNNGDVINNGSIEVLELTENNVAATIEIGPGSGLFSKHLENYGEIQGSGGECYVLAIHENSTHHPGSKIRGLYESAPTGGCLDDKVKDLVANFILPFGDRTGRSKVLSNLKYGWHDTEIEYTLASGQQCLINQEVFVDGGIAVYVNDPQTICAGEEIEIYGEINLDSPTPDEIHTYTWDTHGETIYNNDGFGTLLLKPENTVLVELTGEAQLAPGKTCTGTDDVIITVVPEIEILDNSGDEGQFTICSNETYQFNLSVSPEETEFIYSWSPEEGLSDPHILNPVVSRNSSADYILTVTNADNLKLFSIDVYNMKKEGLITQDEVITKLYNICNILYATEGEFEAAVTSQIGNVYMDMYKEVIKQHAAHGCSVQKEFQCTVLPAPKVSLNGIEGDIRLCGGGEKALEATVSDFDANDITWSWLPVTGLSDPAIPDPVAIVNNKISYTVTATSISNACKDEAVIDIDVYPNNLVVSIDEKACINLNPGEQQLVASGAKSYEWTPATGLSDPNIANPILYPGGLNEYTLNAIIEPEPGKECQVTEILSIDELNWPDAGADINYCIGSDQEISLSASGGRTGTYLWFPATGMGEGGEYSPDPVIQLKSSVTYTLQAENEFGCVNTDKVTVTVDPACRCFSNSGEGISYQWKGTESGDWGDPKNWYSVNPGGIPGNNISDNVIIEAAPNNCILDMDRKISNICVIEGSLSLNGKTLSISGDGTFSGGQVTGDDIHREAPLQLNNPGLQKSVYLNGTEFYCSIKVLNYPEIYLNGSVFHSHAYFELNGKEDVVCEGGNEYLDKVTFSNIGNGQWFLAASNAGSKDTYTMSAVFKNSGKGSINPSARYNDIFTGDLYFEISDGAVVFGTLGGSPILNGNANQYISPVDEINIPPVFRRLVLQKQEDARFSDLVLEHPITIGYRTNVGGDNEGGEDQVETTNDGIDVADVYLELTRGCIYTTSASPLIISSGVKVKGANVENHINGPIRKYGNEDFEFPLGAINRYMPLTIFGSGEDATNSIAVYEACFIAKQQILGPPNEPLKHISECEYWTLTKGEETPGVDIGLTWDRNSCDITTDLRLLQVACFYEGKWHGLGGQEYTGTRTSGSVRNEKKGPSYQAFALGSEVIPGYGPMVGLTFNNYGAVVKVMDENTKMKVGGNILNDEGKKQDFSDVEGSFYNQGEISLSKDWTNNNENFVFSGNPTSGTTRFTGSYQRIRGNEPTAFFNLTADGFGKIQLFNNISVQNSFSIENNEFSTFNYSLHVRRSDPAAVSFQSGFISSKKTGTLKWDLAPDQAYLFPVGSCNKFRPVEIATSSSQTGTKTFQVGMINNDPSVDGFWRKNKAINISKINEQYYHILGQEDQGNLNDVDVTIYYHPMVDGYWQALTAWGAKPENVPPILEQYMFDFMWNKGKAIEYISEIGNTVLNNSPLAAMVTDGIKMPGVRLSVLPENNTSQYALAQGGLVINTADFGNPLNKTRGIGYSLTSNDKKNGSTIFTGNVEDPNHVHTIETGDEPGELLHKMTLQDQNNLNYVPGEIRFTTGPDGKVIPNAHGDRVTFVDNEGNEYPLLEDLYEIPEGYEDIILLKSKPDTPGLCNLESVKIFFSTSNPIMLVPGQFGIEGVPQDDANLSLKILYNDQEIVLEGYTDILGYDWQQITSNGEGAYNFELTVSVIENNENTTHVFKGQFFYYN